MSKSDLLNFCSLLHVVETAYYAFVGTPWHEVTKLDDDVGVIPDLEGFYLEDNRLLGLGRPGQQWLWAAVCEARQGCLCGAAGPAQQGPGPAALPCYPPRTRLPPYCRCLQG